MFRTFYIHALANYYVYTYSYDETIFNTSTAVTQFFFQFNCFLFVISLFFAIIFLFFAERRKKIRSSKKGFVINKLANYTCNVARYFSFENENVA